MASRIRLPLQRVLTAFVAAVDRLDKSLSPRDTITRLQRHTFTFSDTLYVLNFILACFWLTIMTAPPFPYKLLIPLLYTIALLIPLTSQFFLPATPILAWLLAFYSARFIPDAYRPPISVSFLPTLEYVLYGANISDILTRWTHPALDILAWLPYGVIHFVCPFVVAAFLWLFRPKQALHFWARVAGYTNLLGVLIQVLLPCAPPWYELVYGLTPANYNMPGHPGGLMRIDALFHSSGYTVGFRASPVVFGAFPSLHAAWATLEALTLSHFFPGVTRWVWGYTAVLFWATMYLTHHYLIDVVAGACFATFAWYLMLPDDLRGPWGSAPSGAGMNAGAGGGQRRNKYAIYDVEAPSRGSMAGLTDEDGGESDEELGDIAYRSPNPASFPGGAGDGGMQDQQMAHHQQLANQTQLPAQPPSIQTQTGGPGQAGQGQRKTHAHRHTASIASLISQGDRVEDGWSPIGASFAFPPTPTRAEREGRERDRDGPSA